MDEPEDDPPVERVTADQVVAINIRRWRVTQGITQADLGERLGWTATNVSHAERSADPARDRRRFDAQALADIAIALGVPIPALFLPPPDDGERARYVLAAESGEIEMADYMATLVMPDSDDGEWVAQEYRDAWNTAARRYLSPDWQDRVAAWWAEGATPEERATEAAYLHDLRNMLLRGASEIGQIADRIEERK